MIIILALIITIFTIVDSILSIIWKAKAWDWIFLFIFFATNVYLFITFIDHTKGLDFFGFFSCFIK